MRTSRRMRKSRCSGHLHAEDLEIEEDAMVPLLLVLLLILLLFGVGFATEVLWYIALAVLVIWLLGFLFRGPGVGGGRARWYRW